MIKRYEPMGPNRALLEHPRGRWVRYETFEMFVGLMRRAETDLDEAKTEVERLRAAMKRADECLGALVHWHDQDGRVDESWWDEAREILAAQKGGSDG